MQEEVGVELFKHEITAEIARVGANKTLYRCKARGIGFTLPIICSCRPVEFVRAGRSRKI